MNLVEDGGRKKIMIPIDVKRKAVCDTMPSLVSISQGNNMIMSTFLDVHFSAF